MSKPLGIYTPWTAPFGGGVASEAAAVSIAPQRIDIFVRGTNGNIYWQTSADSGGTWSGWKTTGVVENVLAGTAPAVCKYDASVFDLFWVNATTRGLMHKFYQISGAQWRGRQSLGGSCTSTPAAAKVTGAIAHVFVRGDDGTLLDRYTLNIGAVTPTWKWGNGGEQLYKSATSATGYGPAVNARDGFNGIMDVFWVSTAKELWHKQWDQNTWSFLPATRVNLQGGCTSTPTSMYDGSSPLTTQWVYAEVRGGDNLLWGRYALLTSAGDPAISFNSWKGPSQWSWMVGPP
jgi:hypothetical protein